MSPLAAGRPAFHSCTPSVPEISFSENVGELIDRSDGRCSVKRGGFAYPAAISGSENP